MSSQLFSSQVANELPEKKNQTFLPLNCQSHSPEQLNCEVDHKDADAVNRKQKQKLKQQKLKSESNENIYYNQANQQCLQQKQNLHQNRSQIKVTYSQYNNQQSNKVFKKQTYCKILAAFIFMFEILCIFVIVFVGARDQNQYQNDINQKEKQLAELKNIYVFDQSNNSQDQDQQFLYEKVTDPTASPLIEQPIVQATEIIGNKSVNKKIINSQYISIPYGTIPELKVTVEPPPADVNNFSIYGFQNPIQVSTQFDYLNLTKKINFTQVGQLFIKSLPHQIYNFSGLPPPITPSSPSQLPLSNFKSPQDLKSYFQKLNPDSVCTQKPIPRQHEPQYLLAQRLIADPNDPIVLEAEYLYLNEKYKIGEAEQGQYKQQPICILSTGYNLFSRNVFKNIFLSLERVNYTNFKIVYIDDYSTDDTYKEVYKFLDERNSSLRNKITIVRNLQRVSCLPNLYAHSKYCEGIVVICDGDDEFISPQMFQVLNKLYTPDIWYAWTRFIMRQKNGNYMPGCSGPLESKTQDIRTVLGTWPTSHTRTFRKQLMQAVPIQTFLEYQYVPQKNIYYPKFQPGEICDRSQVYAHIEMAGQKHIKYINDFFYHYKYDNPPDHCYLLKIFYEEYKCRMKKPLQPLQIEDLTKNKQKGRINQNFIVPQNLIKKINQTYNKIKDQCQPKIHTYIQCQPK